MPSHRLGPESDAPRNRESNDPLPRVTLSLRAKRDARLLWAASRRECAFVALSVCGARFVSVEAGSPG